MGIFGKQNRTKSQSATTTLIAEGCAINGSITVANQLQIDGQVEGQIKATNQIKISASGDVSGEITTERLIINGHFEGTCYATYIEILSCGHVTGTIYSDNLSIEPGGKFIGMTKPPAESPLETTPEEEDNLSLLNTEETPHLTLDKCLEK